MYRIDAAAYDRMERAHRRVLRANSGLNSRGGTPFQIPTPQITLSALEEEIYEDIRVEEAGKHAEMADLFPEPTFDFSTPSTSPEPEPVPPKEPPTTPRRSTRDRRPTAIAEAARKAKAAASTTPRRGRKNAYATPPASSGTMRATPSPRKRGGPSRKATPKKTEVVEGPKKAKTTRSPKKAALGRAKH